VLCRTENTTALAYDKRYGGCRATKAHSIAKNIWQWCEDRRITITASYINTKDNVIADSLPRRAKDKSDMKLNESGFLDRCREFGQPNIDMFATYLTTQVDRFCSWLTDPKSETVDAFTIVWEDNFYAFPPFNLISRVLRKIVINKVRGIVVVPFWPTQPWYPLFVKLSISKVVTFKAKKDSLYDPYSGRSHSLCRKVSLMSALSGSR